MADVTVKNVDDCEAIYWGTFKRVRAGLGVTSFGMAVIDFPPNTDAYPEHDHGDDGQEEVYTALAGTATLRAGGEEHTLEPGVFARVGPGVKRHIRTGERPARVLCLGATPGKAYEPGPLSEEGAPDPTAGQDLPS